MAQLMTSVYILSISVLFCLFLSPSCPSCYLASPRVLHFYISILFVALMYAIVCFRVFVSPRRILVFILPQPTRFRNSFLGPQYFRHSRRKCSTVSTPCPHPHVGLSLFPKRWRYLFSPQCPVRSCASWAHDALFTMLLYILVPCLV